MGILNKNELVAGEFDLAANDWAATQDFVNASILANRPTTKSVSANYTLILSDYNKIILMSGATITIPNSSSVNFPIGTIIEIHQVTTTTVYVVASGGVTIQSRSNLTTSAGQYAVFGLEKIQENTWALVGDLV